MSFLDDVTGGAWSDITGQTAANRAADAQTSAANSSNQVALQIYNQQRADQSAWRDAGVSALNQIHDQLPQLTKNFTMADFQADPGYQFRMQEGQKAIERSAAARGNLNSGATLKSLTNYAQGMGSEEYNNAYNRFTTNQNNTFNKLSTLAGLGQNANAATGAAGQNYSNQYGNNMSAIGNANSAAAMAGYNGTMNLANMGMQGAMMYAMV